MIGLTKGVIAVSALVATGLVTIDDYAKQDLRPASIIENRHPILFSNQPITLYPVPVDLDSARQQAAAALATMHLPTVSTRKSDRLFVVPKLDCRHQKWPNITSECLTPKEGNKPLRSPTRFASADRSAG